MKKFLFISSLFISTLLLPIKASCQEAPGSDGHENDSTLIIPEQGLTNYPNPIRTSTTIQYSLPVKAHIVLKIYSATGSLVFTIFDGYKEAGTYKEQFNASNVARGTYVCRLSIGTTYNETTASRLLFVAK